MSVSSEEMAAPFEGNAGIEPAKSCFADKRFYHSAKTPFVVLGNSSSRWGLTLVLLPRTQYSIFRHGGKFGCLSGIEPESPESQSSMLTFATQAPFAVHGRV